MLSALPLTDQNILKPAQLTFWLKTAVPLIFDGDAAIQDAAIETFEKVIPFLMMSNYHSHPDWQKTKRDTVNRYERIFYDNSIFDRNLNNKKSIPFCRYTKEITSLFQRNNAKWYRAWCLFIRLMDIEIPRSATILNQFLGIVEPALRSAVVTRRAEGYLCWRVSITLFNNCQVRC